MRELKIKDKQIFFTLPTMNIFLNHRQVANKEHENGGILLGQVDEIGNRILICRASIPGTSDKSGVSFFDRDRRKAQHIVDYEFHNSAGKNTYLGEWHTHPDKFARPSDQDLNMIIGQYATNELRIKFILLCIIGQEELFLGIFDGETIASAVSPFT